jgi:hypothetical protein
LVIWLCYCLFVPDDERTRRRLGDATKARIDDLASGWTVDPEPAPELAPKSTPAPAPEASPPASPPRKKPRTVPPPPPGSEARKALEQAIVETKSSEVPRIELGDVKPTNPPPAARAPTTHPPAPVRAPTTNPPPPPPARSKPTTSPPSPPPGRAKPPTQPPPIPPPRPGQLPRERTPPVIIDASLVADAEDASLENLAKLAVPVGEFDTAGPTVDEEKLRVAFAHATIKRDAAEALLQIPSAPATVVKAPSVETLLGETAAKLRGDPTSIDPKTSPFERGDPTTEGLVAREDATSIEEPARERAKGGTLRTASMLRRKRGLVGDVRYVFTALSGIREARKEQQELEDKQQLRQTSRRHHLVTLGRTAVTADAFDHPALGKAREALQAVEDERSKHAGAVAASDAELERVRRDREAKTKQYAADQATTTTELAELAKKLEPLEKDAAAARRKAATLNDQLRRIAKKIADTEALLVSVKGEKMDRAGIQAEIATLKADQKSVQRDEPTIAAELDALEPRIAAIHAARTEAEKLRDERERAEAEDQRRTTELYEAIGAKRKVVERAATEAEAERDKVLFELGDRLYVDRPDALAAQLSPIDRIDLELGETDRRIMELREILANVDRAKMIRGSLAIFLAVVVAGAFVAWLLYMLL